MCLPTSSAFARSTSAAIGSSSLDRAIDWELFRKTLEEVRSARRKSAAGRKPFDAVMMFKIMILQSLYNLSDDAVEYQIRDRLSFHAFSGDHAGRPRSRRQDPVAVPRKTDRGGELIETPVRGVRRFSDRARVCRRARAKSSMRASLRRRASATRVEENETIKNGGEPQEWAETPHKQRQKDIDARWTQKNGVNHYGYTNHVAVDVKHKFVRRWAVTGAAVHDSQLFEELLDERNSNGNVWADSAYRTPDNFEVLKKQGFREKIQRKGVRGRTLTEREKQGNRARSKVRSRVEHVFGAMKMRAGDLIVRTIGIVRARCKIALRNLTYSMDAVWEALGRARVNRGCPKTATRAPTRRRRRVLELIKAASPAPSNPNELALINRTGSMAWRNRIFRGALKFWGRS